MYINKQNQYIKYILTKINKNILVDYININYLMKTYNFICCNGVIN